MTTTLITNTDRTAAVRLALGAALAHEATAKSSNRALAVQIGCGETTVRRYRKIATDIGLIGSIRKGSTPAILSVPRSLQDDLGSVLMELREVTEYAASAFGEQIYARACTLSDLLNQKPTKEDLLFIQSATERLSLDAEVLDEGDFEH